MIIRAQYPDLVLADMLPALDSLIFKRFNRFEREYSKIFNVQSSVRWGEQTTTMSGLGLLQTVAENADVDLDEPVQGFDKTYLHTQYALGFGVSKVMADDDKFSLIRKQAQDLGSSADETLEIVSAAVFNNGFNAAFPGPDGVSLFSTAHPQPKAGGTQSNRAAASQLSVTTLMDSLTSFRSQTDYSGRKLRIPADRLIVPGALEFSAAEILGGSMRSDTANRTINALRRRDGMPSFDRSIVWDYLTDAAAWFIAGPQEDLELRFYWRERPNLIHDFVFRSRTMLSAIWMRFSVGFSDYIGLYGVPSS